MILQALQQHARLDSSDVTRTTLNLSHHANIAPAPSRSAAATSTTPTSHLPEHAVDAHSTRYLRSMLSRRYNGYLRCPTDDTSTSTSQTAPLLPSPPSPDLPEGELIFTSSTSCAHSGTSTSCCGHVVLDSTTPGGGLLDLPPPIRSMVWSYMDNHSALAYLSSCRSLRDLYHSFPLTEAVSAEQLVRLAAADRYHLLRSRLITAAQWILALLCMALLFAEIRFARHVQRRTLPSIRHAGTAEGIKTLPCAC